MKKICYFIPIMCVFLTFCSKRDQVASNLMLESQTDSMSFILSKSSQFTSVNDFDAVKFRFRYFADVEKLVALLPKDFSKKIYLEKMDTTSLKSIDMSREYLGLCSENDDTYGALSPYYETLDYIPTLAENAGPAGEYKVEAVVPTLNPFYSYLIKYDLGETPYVSFGSSGHTVTAIGMNPLDCISITDVDGIDEFIQPTYVYTYVSWISSLHTFLGTISVNLGIRVRADLPN